MDENEQIERDPRWENVQAYVQEWEGNEDLLRFFIEITVDGVPYISNIVVAKNELESFDMMYAHTLNEMVYHLDALLKEHGK